MTLSPRGLLGLLGFGFAALVGGLVLLLAVFADELERTEHGLAIQRTSAAALARRAFLDELDEEREQAVPRLLRWEEDVLEDAEGLLLFDHLEQRLPPRTAAAEASSFASLERELEVGAPDDAVWNERIRLARDVAQTTRPPIASSPQARQALAAYLDHASRFELAPLRHLAAHLVVIEALLASPGEKKRLLEGLLMDGLEAEGRQVRSAASALVLARTLGQVSDDDVRSLRARLEKDLSAARLAPGALQAALRLPRRALPPPPKEPGLWKAGGELWQVWPRDDLTLGHRLDLKRTLDATAAALKKDGLLPADAALRLEDLAWTPLSTLVVSPTSSTWEEGLARARSRYRTKLALAGLTALLGAAVLGLAGLFVRRQQRFVDLKNDFVAAVSHELRTPVAAIRLLAETLERRVGGDDRARDYPRRIVREADRLSFLVDNVLSWGRIDRGRWKVRAEAVDLRELLDELKQEVEDHVPGAEVVVDLSPGTRVDADPELCRLLFSNLARNGVTYNQRAPKRVRFSLSPDAPQAVLVEDNGVGIPEEDRARVFEPFERTTGAERVASKGSGLGLSLCRRILHLHGGELRLARSSDEGSLFVVELGRDIHGPAEDDAT